MLYFFTYRGTRYSVESPDLAFARVAVRICGGVRAEIEMSKDRLLITDRWPVSSSKARVEIEINKKYVVAALRSIIVGGPDELAIYREAFRLIPIPAAQGQFDEFWHEQLDHPRLVEDARTKASMIEAKLYTSIEEVIADCDE